MTALGQVGSSNAAVIVSTKTIRAVIFSALLLHEEEGLNNYIGGALIVLACLALSLKLSDFERLFEDNAERKKCNSLA